MGRGKEPVQAYLGIEEIVRVGGDAGVDAIHPGYGFLSQNPEPAAGCVAEGIVWIGPPASFMEGLGDKVSARALAERAGVPVMPTTGRCPTTSVRCSDSARPRRPPARGAGARRRRGRLTAPA